MKAVTFTTLMTTLLITHAAVANPPTINREEAITTCERMVAKNDPATIRLLAGQTCEEFVDSQLGTSGE